MYCFCNVSVHVFKTTPMLTPFGDGLSRSLSMKLRRPRQRRISKYYSFAKA